MLGGSKDQRYEDSNEDDDTVKEEVEELNNIYKDDYRGGFSGNSDSNSEDIGRPPSYLSEVEDTDPKIARSLRESDNNHEEDSAFDFVSEYSVYNNEDSDVEVISTNKYTLQKLYD